MTPARSPLALSHLEADPDLQGCVYDLKEIVASQSEIEELLRKLDGFVGRDPSETARHLTFLRVEIYSHLLSHIRNLKRPLTEVISRLYASLGPDEPLELPGRQNE